MLKFSSVLAFVAVLLCALLISFADAKKPKWTDLEKGTYSFDRYVRDFGRKYTGEEYIKRKTLFERELATVVAHNKDTTKLWKKGVNKFSDWTEAEKKSMRGFSMSLKQRYLAEKGSLRKMHKLMSSSRVLPQTVDYRYGVNGIPVLTAVKDQGQCGSCYAHAATESVETAYALATNQLFVLSQQQVASCSVNPNECGGTGGCEGGIAEIAIDTVSDISGLNQEWSYPYRSYNGQDFACSFWANQTVVYTSGYTAVQSNNGGAVMDALVGAGPLAISADASDWSSYEGGIYHGCDYAKNISMDHAIQMVGYGFDAGLNSAYWTVRNSWAPTWGENGYIRVLRLQNGEACGWNVDPQNGNGCKGDTAPVWACGMCGVLYETLYVTPRFSPF